jgi:hypothetical protein
MKLKAPEGVGDPCVAGVAIIAHDGLYEVEAEIGALLIECFGFVEAGAAEAPKIASPGAPAAAKPASAPRRRANAKKTPAET